MSLEQLRQVKGHEPPLRVGVLAQPVNTVVGWVTLRSTVVVVVYRQGELEEVTLRSPQLMPFH